MKNGNRKCKDVGVTYKVGRALRSLTEAGTPADLGGLDGGGYGYSREERDDGGGGGHGDLHRDGGERKYSTLNLSGVRYQLIVTLGTCIW